ncbi:MAG: CBS domain-containing protein [Actinomycetota bacterium]|nr:CBS domain-containing protein [Actinomycetota bacterium]
MRTRDLAVPEGVVTAEEPLIDAARRLVDEALAGLVIVSETGKPLAVLPASQVLGLVVPGYVKDDPALAAVVDEASADRLAERLVGLPVQHVLDDARPDLLATIEDDATLLEAAAVMARKHTPVLVVVDDAGQAVGTLSARDVLGRLLGSL